MNSIDSVVGMHRADAGKWPELNMTGSYDSGSGEQDNIVKDSIFPILVHEDLARAPSTTNILCKSESLLMSKNSKESDRDTLIKS